MTTRDLGDITAPLLVCGGVYGNLEALNAMAEFQKANAIPDTHVIHTGDVVAYCADAEDVTRFVAARGWPSIKGNVEEQIAMGADNCGCGFEEGSVCDAASQRWYAHAITTLSDASKDWMAALPEHLTFQMAGLKVRVVHGAVSQINRFMFESLPEAEFANELDEALADIVIAGHTGLPFTRQIGNRYWHNSGSAGMPANDGTPRVWVSVLTPHESHLNITHHALEFDAKTAAKKIRNAPLVETYADALVSGLWPSLDILPEQEEQMTSQPIDLDGTSFSITAKAAQAAE